MMAGPGTGISRWEIALHRRRDSGDQRVQPAECPGEQGQTNRLLALVRTQGKLRKKSHPGKRSLKLYFKESASTIPATLKQFLVSVPPGDYWR